MFTSIINAIIAMMTAATTTAGAVNKIAVSLDNLATVAEQTSLAQQSVPRSSRNFKLSNTKPPYGVA